MPISSFRRAGLEAKEMKNPCIEFALRVNAAVHWLSGSSTVHPNQQLAVGCMQGAQQAANQKAHKAAAMILSWGQLCIKHVGSKQARVFPLVTITTTPMCFLYRALQLELHFDLAHAHSNCLAPCTLLISRHSAFCKELSMVTCLMPR